MAKTFMASESGGSSSHGSPDPRAELNAAAFDSMDSGSSSASTLDVGGSSLLSAGGDPIAGARAARGGRGFSSKKDVFGALKRQVSSSQRVSKTNTGSYDKDLTNWSTMLGTEGSAQTTSTSTSDPTGGGSSSGTRSQGTDATDTSAPDPFQLIGGGDGGSGAGGLLSTPLGLIAGIAAFFVALLALAAGSGGN